MNASDRAKWTALSDALSKHAVRTRALPGILDPTHKETLIRQMLDSLHRVRYPQVIATRTPSYRRCNPSDAEYFDPLYAAVYQFRLGNFDEACWLVFLFVHFGKHNRGGYRYIRDVYGRLGDGHLWDWHSVSANIGGFLHWLSSNHVRIRETGGPGGFGNHRKYESLQPTHTGRAIATYVGWVAAAGSHRGLFDGALAAQHGDSGKAFDALYQSMSVVERFGRTAKFDYLTMIGKLGLAAINPASTYLEGATGPLKGARLLFGCASTVSTTTLERWLIALDGDLGVGAQVLEDSICNWQKSPAAYRSFRG